MIWPACASSSGWIVLGWLPGTGRCSATGNGGITDLVIHIVLPAATLALLPLSIIARLTRSSMLDVIGEDCIRTARAKGLSDRTVIGKHAFRNILVAMATVFGLQAGVLLAGGGFFGTGFFWAGDGVIMVDPLFVTHRPPVTQRRVFVVATILAL